MVRFLGGFILLFLPSPVSAQSTSASPQTPQPESSQNAPRPANDEIVSRDTPTTFRVRVNVVLVRVVVRDSEGEQIGTMNRGVVIPR
jgi:hypothetical protein